MGMDPIDELAIDGFPLDSKDPDIGLHRELSAWLEVPKAPTVPVPLRIAPAHEQRWDWLRTSLIRFQWARNHAALLPQARTFESKLASLIGLLVNKISSLGEAHDTQLHHGELILLTTQAAKIAELTANSIFLSDVGRVLLSVAKQNSAETLGAMHSMLRELPPKRDPSNRLQELAWHLFLNEHDPDDGDPCWSASVRRELKALKPAKKKLWTALLQLAPTGPTADPKREVRLKKALDRLGREEWESRIVAWTARFEASEFVALERPGQKLLSLAIAISGVAESTPLVSSLAALIDTRWDSSRSEAFWIEVAPRLAMGLYPHPETHDAIRKLADRPECAGLADIQRIAKEVRAASEVVDASAIGIDRFPLARDLSLAQLQLRIDNLLRQPAESAEAHLRYLLPQRSASGKEKLLRAIQQRIDWLSEHTPALDRQQPSMEWAKFANWNNLLKSVRSKLLQAGAGIEQVELLKLLREGNNAAFDRVAEYTVQHGYKRDIVEAVRQYHQTLHGSVSDQARRQHVGWWLWLEDVTPINAEECWSSTIRADLRTFTGTRQKAWLDLIGNMTFAVSTKPPAKWTKAAEGALSAVSPEDFRNQLRSWLAPMAPGQNAKPLRISTPGRDVLRCLIWDALLCPRDPQLDEALGWIDKATWKNKESRDRMLKIYGPLDYVLSARNPELARQLDTSQKLLRKSSAAAEAPDFGAGWSKAISKILMSMPMRDRIELHADHIFVRGERDHYRIGMNGAITRRNGRPVRVNMDALPEYLTQTMRSAIDVLDFSQDIFQPNWMHLFSLATILAHDAQWENAIE